MLVLCADHGCDPTWPGSDHTREHIPVLAFGNELEAGSLGKRKTSTSKTKLKKVIENTKLKKDVRMAAMNAIAVMPHRIHAFALFFGDSVNATPAPAARRGIVRRLRARGGVDLGVMGIEQFAQLLADEVARRGRVTVEN